MIEYIANHFIKKFIRKYKTFLCSQKVEDFVFDGNDYRMFPGILTFYL